MKFFWKIYNQLKKVINIKLTYNFFTILVLKENKKCMFKMFSQVKF